MKKKITAILITIALLAGREAAPTPTQENTPDINAIIQQSVVEAIAQYEESQREKDAEIAELKAQLSGLEFVLPSAPAGEDPNRQYFIPKTRIPKLQKLNDIIQPNLESPGFLAGILAWDDAVFQKPQSFPFANMANAVQLIFSDDFRILVTQKTVIHTHLTFPLS